MPGYVGLQLAVELTNILPVRQWAADGIKSMLDLARDLRKSGSDIVVEEDLADVLGRGRVSRTMEKAFKEAVKISKFTPLYTSRDGSTAEVELHSGPGPTVLRAFQDSRYFTTTLILSMLAYYHDRQPLAFKLSAVMDRRFEAEIQGARPSPGFEGISATIESCSSQTSAFHWATLGQQVEARLRESITGYRFSPNYYVVSTTVLLGAVDFFCRVQQLPLHRKVSVSSESGCIVLIIWAHFILDLTVTVSSNNSEVVFGNSRESQVYIWWTGTLSQGYRGLGLPTYDYADNEQYIQLMDKDATVNISCEPDESDNGPLQHLQAGAERHPLAGYCTTFLRRVLNVYDLTPDDDPIFEDAACLITGLAIMQSRRLCRGGDDETDYGDRSIPYHLEAWRIITAAKMLFRGILLDETKVSRQTQYYTHNRFNAETLPQGFTPFLEKASADPMCLPSDAAGEMLQTIGSLGAVVLAFSHVSRLDDCSDVPLVMTDDYVMPRLDITNGDTSDSRVLLKPSDIFHNIVKLLDHNFDIQENSETFSTSSHHLSLYSIHGWSVHLSTVGDEDPSTLRPEIVHLRRGTPVNVKTKERKRCIRDGIGFSRRSYPDVFPWLRGSVTPKPAARLLSRTEYWTSLRDEFQAVSYLELEPCPEWDLGMRGIDEIFAYRRRQTDLWQVRVTPTCSCNTREQDQGRISRRESPKPLILGPDVAALVGWFPDPKKLEPENDKADRIIVLLSCGDRHLRWLALEGQHFDPNAERRTILRALGCCEKCALAHVESLEGKWILVL